MIDGLKSIQMTPEQMKDREKKAVALLESAQDLFPQGMNNGRLALVIRMLLAGYGIEGEEATEFLSRMVQYSSEMDAMAETNKAIYQAQTGGSK